ncbi:MAG: sigma-70 family RNA polymerase sigma factor [Phycisphaerales bacterium]|nr:sigma-70 family RNA polymerase sigma factor [Phycisphaerales bacterium]
MPATPPHLQSSDGAHRSAGDPVLSPADLRELQLVEAYRQGDRSALETLLAGYQDRLYAVCLRMIGDADQARDLTQDTLVRVITGLGNFDGRSKLSTWMIRVAMNVCLTSLRRAKVRRGGDAGIGGVFSGLSRGDDGDDEDGRGGLGSWAADPREPGPERRVERSEELRNLQRAMAAIEPGQRAILILRDMQGLDYQHIAEVLDVPAGTVKSRLFRARVALRQEIDRLGPPTTP